MSQEPNKGFFTPFNIIAGIIIIVGLYLTFLRFTKGIGAVSNLDHNNPWGIWIGFDLLCGVALAAGGFTTSAACYIFGLKKYHSAVRPALLTAFLGYALVVFALHYDVGRPWRLPYPVFYSQGTTSLLYEVGLCVFLYLTVLALEFLPAALEWLGERKYRRILVKLTLLFTIFGVILSTMHQSSLGALYILAPTKLHPLWHSPYYMPLQFFVSAIFAGLSMVIFESTLSHRAFHHKMDKTHLAESDGVALGFAKGASTVMAGYLVIKALGLAVENKWSYLFSGYGVLYLTEILGFVLLPCILYAIGAREKRVKLVRFTAFWTVLGIVFNRLNISLIAFNYNLPPEDRYFPSWQEIGITLFVVTVGVVAFRFIVTRMPIFYEHPDYEDAH